MMNRRSQRHPVEIQGRYRTGSGIAKDVIVKDLSLEGCSMFDRFCNLSEGAFLTIRIGSIGPIEAHVKWVEKGLEISDEATREPLQNELESYRAKKPFRELLGNDEEGDGDEGEDKEPDKEEDKGEEKEAVPPEDDGSEPEPEAEPEIIL